MPPQQAQQLDTYQIPVYYPGTIVIDNFGVNGLSRRAHGQLKSGYLKYLTSWGIDPFTKPGALTWQEQLVQIDSSHTTLKDVILHFKVRVESGTSYAYGVDYSGNLYKITVSSDSISALNTSTGLTLKYGGGFEFFNISSVAKLCVGNDAGFSYFNTDGTSGTAVTTGVTWTSNVPRPLKVWGQYVYAGNGSALVQIGTGGSVTLSDALNSSIPPQYTIVDLALSADGNYLKILCTRSAPVDLKTADPTGIAAGVETVVFYWNGTDTVVTSLNTYPSMVGTALHTFGTTALMFGQDFLGGVVRDENQKIATLPITAPSRPGGADASADLAIFAARDYISSKQQLSLFAVGTPDAMTSSGVWRMHMAKATSPETDVQTVGAFRIVQNLTYPTSVTGGSTLTDSKFYVSTYETESGSNSFQLYKGTLTPRGSGTPMLGVAETETEFFPERMKIPCVRVYIDPAASGNGFQLDLIDAQGNAISGASGFTYAYAAGSDPTQVQGSLQMLEFLCQSESVQGCSVRVTHTGTVNTVIHKVELELSPMDK
jgi:hypothetical protein